MLFNPMYVMDELSVAESVTDVEIGVVGSYDIE